MRDPRNEVGAVARPAGTAWRVAQRRPAGLVAWLLRRPVWLYEHGLGWLLGDRFTEIVHRGRKSRRVYRSVVEVVRFDPTTTEVIVVSAWRGRTDWYRNLESEPALEIRTDRLRFVPQQRFLTPEETLCEMQMYLRHHRVAGRLLPWLFGIDLRAPEETWRPKIMDFFRGVSFRPPHGSESRIERQRRLQA